VPEETAGLLDRSVLEGIMDALEDIGWNIGEALANVFEQLRGRLLVVARTFRSWLWLGQVWLEPGGSPMVEADEVVLCVIVEPMRLQELECIVPKAADAEIERAGADVVRDIGEVVPGSFDLRF
jgi:hypothetical protein